MAAVPAGAPQRSAGTDRAQGSVDQPSAWRGGPAIGQFTQLSGLTHQNAYLGLSLTILLFSLMGIPPLAGFFAKLMVLTSTLNQGYNSLALVAIIGSIIGAVNYLNLIKILNMNKYLSAGTVSNPSELNTNRVSKGMGPISYSISIIIAFTILG